MATNTPLNSDTSILPDSSNNNAEQGLCLPFNEALKELPVFLQPSDGQEQKDLALFLSQIEDLHKPIADKLSARFVFNFLDHILDSTTPTTKGPSEVNIPQQLQEHTENIAFEIANSVISGFDLHNTTRAVLNVLQEVSWETKAALSITTFILTFGDNGLNLCEESKVSLNEIQMFAKPKDEYKHQSDGNDNLFTIIYKLIGFILEFEVLPATYARSKDPKVKIARTHLIVVVYWIIRIIVAASTSHIMKLSYRGNEFVKANTTLWELSSLWSKKLKDLDDSDHLKDILSQLQDLLKEDVDIGEYNKIKETIEKRNHSDNMKVLNALFPSTGGDLYLLYDCLRKRKVHLDELKGAHVLLYISGPENITPEVDETILNEFIDTFDLESKNEVECKLVWMPVAQHKEATKEFLVKPLLDFCYVYHQKLNQVLGKQKKFKDWYSICDPSRITNEVKKLLRDDWKYKGKPMIVVLDTKGNVLNHNAIHMFYIWGIMAFPFTSEREVHMWYATKDLLLLEPICQPLPESLHNLALGKEYFFYYGGENIEWIRSFTELVGEVASELGIPINMVYVGRSHNLEVVRRVKEENLSHCFSDQFYMWLFWIRLESILHSATHAEIYNKYSWIKREMLQIQNWINYDKSNVGWAFLSRGYNQIGLWHGKVVMSTLKELKLWKEEALRIGFGNALYMHCEEVNRKIFPFTCLEYPTDALKAPLETMECPYCKNQMQQYTTFVCYHPGPSR